MDANKMMEEFEAVGYLSPRDRVLLRVLIEIGAATAAMGEILQKIESRLERIEYTLKHERTTGR